MVKLPVAEKEKGERRYPDQWEGLTHKDWRKKNAKKLEQLEKESNGNGWGEDNWDDGNGWEDGNGWDNSDWNDNSDWKENSGGEAKRSSGEESERRNKNGNNDGKKGKGKKGNNNTDNADSAKKPRRDDFDLEFIGKIRSEMPDKLLAVPSDARLEEASNLPGFNETGYRKPSFLAAIDAVLDCLVGTILECKNKLLTASIENPDACKINFGALKNLIGRLSPLQLDSLSEMRNHMLEMQDSREGECLMTMISIAGLV
jgi:hypothetical protein